MKRSELAVGILDAIVLDKERLVELKFILIKMQRYELASEVRSIERILYPIINVK